MLCEEISRRKADRLSFATREWLRRAMSEAGRLKECNRRDK